MATSKPASVLRALLDHVAALVFSPPLPVSYPEPGEGADGEAGFEPPEDRKYLEVQFFPNDPAWRGLSAGKMDQGLLQIGVVWPKRQGLIAPLEVVGVVEAHFAKETTLFHGGFKVTVTSDPSHSAALDEPDAVKIPVTIPWKA